MTTTKIISLFLCFCLIIEQSVFAQTIDLSRYFVRGSNQAIPQSDKFRPLHLRYISYDNQANDFKILLDKGDFFNQKTEKPKNEKTLELEKTTQELMKYFFIGLALPNEKFWVNLRLDSPDNILDPDIERTDIGKIFLEADLQLKKDTSGMTSPQTKEGREYWDKLYKKAGELFGSENITIPTITRPWIVPDEVIIRESSEGAHIYKATLKVMLEEDYLRGTKDEGRGTTINYSFNDPRLKELNEYSTWLIKESIILKLTKEINSARRYAPLRQVYYSLILAQWFKQKYGSSRSARAPGISAPVNSYIDLIDSGNLANLFSSQPYDKQAYFQQYQKSFKDGEYNLQEPIHTPMGQSIRRYMSGGMQIDCSSAIEGGKIFGAGSPVFGNLKQSIKKYCIYLLVSLSGAIFPATFANALTIDQRYDQGLRFEAVVGNERSRTEVLNKIGEELSINPETIRKFIDGQGEEPVKSNDRIDVTALFGAKYVEDVLKKCKVVLKKSVELDDKKYDVYFIAGNSKDEALRELGESVGDTIFINIDSVKTYSEKMENIWGKIYPSITTEEVYDDVIRGAIVHELMHGLLYELFRRGLKTPYLDNVLNSRLGEISPEELYRTKQELLASLAQIESLLRPRILLADFITSLIEKANINLPPEYSNAYENNINVMLFNDPNGKNEEGLVEMLKNLISGSVSNTSIGTRSKRALIEYLQEGEDDIGSKLATIQKIAGSLLNELEMLRELEQGNSVKLRINPALLPKINNPNFRKELQELNIKTIVELVERLGLTTEFLGGSIVVRVQPETGPGRSFYKKFPQQEEGRGIPSGCTININPVKTPGGSSPVRSSSDSPVKKKIMEYVEQAEERLKKEVYDDTLGMIDFEAMKNELKRCVSVEDISDVLHLYGDSDILNKRFGHVIDAMVENGVVTIDRGRVFLVDEFSTLSFIFGFEPSKTRGRYVPLNEERWGDGIILLNADEERKHIEILSTLVHEDLHATEGIGGGQGLQRYVFEGFITYLTINKLDKLFADSESAVYRFIYDEMSPNERLLLAMFGPKEFIMLQVYYILELAFVAKIISEYGPEFMMEVYNTGNMKVADKDKLLKNKFGEKFNALSYFGEKSDEVSDKFYVEIFDRLDSFIEKECHRQMMRILDGDFSADELRSLTESFSGMVEMLRGMSEENFKKYFLKKLYYEKHIDAWKKCLDELYEQDIFANPANKAKVEKIVYNIFFKIDGNRNNSAGSPIAGESVKGGIDLSRINKSVRTESVSSPGAGGGNSPVDVDFDLNEELARLQNMLNVQIIPSADRLNRYARAARASPLSSPDSADSALSLVAETFRLQEEKSVPAPTELKALAAWLEQET